MKKLLSFFLIMYVMLSAFPSYSVAASVANFSDVKNNDWFYKAVSYVTNKGLFNGTNTATFSPGSPMTRGMFVTVLGRYGGAPSVSTDCILGIVQKSDVNMRSAPSATNTSVIACFQKNTQLEVLSTVSDLHDSNYSWFYVKYKGMLGYIRNDLMKVMENGFSDVSVSSYYSSYVQWAFSSGIASETGEGTFSPERNISREEICSMLFNYAAYKNYQLNPTISAVTFIDNASISADCASAVSTMQQIGVVTGYGDGNFRPFGSATRAEVSAMLMRFINAIGYKKTNESSYNSAGNYIFGTEVPPSTAVGTDYFSNACFIGHSIVNGMHSYFGLSNTDFYAVNGASAKYILQYEDFNLSTTHSDENGNVVQDIGTLSNILSENSYSKVYIMLGINEIGCGTNTQESFYTNMSTLIDLVRTSQPNAKIYLFSATPVSQVCSESRDDVNRDNILTFNNIIKQLCQDKKTYYLNVFDLLCDENGFLPKNSGMSDGIHILSSEYTKIKSYIYTHVV